MARPTDYNDEILKKAQSYLDLLPEDEETHSIEGLADYINISRSNIYLWASQEDKKEFSDILERIREKQAKKLISKGLRGEFNASITKLMLSKHGYVEKSETDITSKGERIVATNPEAVSAAEAAYIAQLDGTPRATEST